MTRSLQLLIKPLQNLYAAGLGLFTFGDSVCKSNLLLVVINVFRCVTFALTLVCSMLGLGRSLALKVLSRNKVSCVNQIRIHPTQGS
jgi:hypothetical protein